MAYHVNIKEIAKLVDEKPFEMNWFSYIFGGGWGSRLTKYEKRGAVQGLFTPGISNDVGINKVYKKLKNDDFSDISGFYVAILCFFGKKVYKNLDFVEKVPHNSINYVVNHLECPIQYQDEIKWICDHDFDFISFIYGANKLERTNFDKKSAISVYKLQGDDAIFRILCQMFYVNKGAEGVGISLIDDLPVQLPVQVSNYLSGCHFPVAVSPYSDEFKWQETQNGHFLYTKFKGDWRVLDVAGVGRVNLSNYALGNRLNYVAGGGLAVPYVICWNWMDIIDAYHRFGQNLLVRDLKNDLFSHYWFIFGPKSRINVRFKNNFINASKKHLIKPKFDANLISVNKHGFAYLCINLDGDFINYCQKKDVFYSDSEVFDWFELGKML